jgi:hypothetical protein
LKKNIIEYYRSKLSIKESCDFNSKLLGIAYNINPNNTELQENGEKDLIEVYDPLTKLLFYLRNNENDMINIILKLTKSDEMDDIVNLLCHFFYENILVQNPEHEDILYLCYLLLEKEIDGMKTESVASFLDRSFIGRLLKSFTRRQDIKAYLSMILGRLILDMENSTDNFLDVDPLRIYDHIKNKNISETFDKSFNIEKTKKIFELDRKLMLGDKLKKTGITKFNSINYTYNNNSDICNMRSSSMLTNEGKNLSSRLASSYTEGTGLNKFDESYFISPLIDESDFNNDYLIDLTKDELQFRMEKEENLEMKDFCN